MKRLFFILIAILPLTGPVSAVDQKQIDEAVAQLGDPDAGVRDRAAKLLWEAGREAERALRQALKADDPEVVSRSREILSDFEHGIYPDTPEEIAAQLRAYRAGHAVQKRAAVSALVRLGRRGLPAAARLSKVEQDSTLRAQVFHELAQLGDVGAVGFLAEGDLKSAQQCLEAGLANPLARPTRSYATFLVMTGAADQKAQELREHLGLQDGISSNARTLAYLLRAKGDLKGARQAAEHARDEKLLEGIMIEQGDWKGLANEYAMDRAVENIEKLGFAAAYRRLAGESGEAQRVLDAVVSRAKRDDVWFSFKALVLNDRPSDAIEVLIKCGEMDSALELLLVQQRYGEALKLAEKASAGAPKALYLARSGRALHHLGEKEKALELLKQAHGSAQKEGMEGWVAVVDAQLRCGRRGEALQVAADALSKRNDPPGELFVKLFGKEAVAGEVWWKVLRMRHFTEPAPWIMQRADALIAGKWTKEEIQALWQDVLVNKIQVRAADEIPIFRAVANVLERAELANELEVARRLLAKTDRDGREHLSLAAGAMKRKEWEAAEKLCERAIAKDAARAGPRYLRGYALVQMGREKEGREMMKLARLMPLGDDAERYALAEVMSKAGLAAEAAAEHEFLARVGELSGWEAGNAMRILAERAREARDDLKAAELWERSTLPCLKGSTGFTEVGAYLWVPHLVHKMRAKGLINSGKIDEGLKEMRLCEQYLPGDVSVLMEMASKLREAGRERDLEEMAQRALERQQALLREYPRAARLHNSLAWMLARCRVKLDVALVHAHRGVEMEPKSAAIWDTLGEVYFQMGERKKAIEAMKICIEIEPEVERHWLQMKRFETGEASSEPPN